MKIRKEIIYCLLLSFVVPLNAQIALLKGDVTEIGIDRPIEQVTIYLDSTNISTETNENGQFELTIPANQAFKLIATRLDFDSKSIAIPALQEGTTKEIILTLSPVVSDIEIVVAENRIEQTGVIREGVAALARIPNNSSNLESLLPGIALGVNTGIGGELSAQYNVRGGNFDENLVYVNDFIIHRPQLIRASVREGLTFSNPDLIQNFTFSSGGFQANYGDKLSSVLDIQYKRPETMAGSISLSLLGGAGHLEGKALIGKKKRAFRYLIGFRFKNTNHLLNSLDTRDATKANFRDFQAYLSYDFNAQLTLAFINNRSVNEYNFQPTTSRTTSGSGFTNVFELLADFDGAETTQYNNEMGGISLNFQPKKAKHPTFLKFIFSVFESEEVESSDILTKFTLNRLDGMPTSPTFGEAVENLGNGGQFDLVQNELDIDIGTLELKGGTDFKGKKTATSSFLQYGLAFQYEFFKDSLFELQRVGQEALSLSVDIRTIPLVDSLNAQNDFRVNRWSGFVQNTITKSLKEEKIVKLTTGFRAAYGGLTSTFFITPRLQLLVDNKKNTSYRLATGFYFQPPFYRELRNKDGRINESVVPQKSWQIVGGITHDFYIKKLSKQKFRWMAEVYYKKLWDLVSYNLEDVRIIYAGENDAEGYAIGLDVRLNGNFTPNSESWINLSLLQTRESLNGVEHQDALTGAILEAVPRPNDRFMNLSVYFQDNFPRIKRVQTYLNFNIGTGLPFGLGENTIVRNNLRYRTNHQVNIGFSFSLWDAIWLADKPNHWLRFSKSAWLSLDIINLLNVRNVASNRVIATSDRNFIFPNRLTSRTFNVRFKVDI